MIPSELTDQPVTVIKLGGSLFSWKDLPEKLHRFFDANSFSRPLLIPGGGPFADAVRELDRIHQWPEALSHELAVRTMSLSARFISVMSDRLTFASSEISLSHSWEQNRIPVLDAAELVLNDSPLPESWDVTSDSIAAWIASLHSESSLILLKSTNLPSEHLSPVEAARRGLVDGFFSDIVQRVRTVSWYNFREDQCLPIQWIPRCP